MADKPTVLPIWDTAETNVIAPDAAHQLDGWLAPGGVPEKPPFQNFNFWQNNVYKWAAYLEELTDSLLKVGRAQFAPVSNTQLSLASGGYIHHGTKSQVLLIESTLTHTITSPGTSQWQYLYLDDSAIVSAGTGDITGTEVINSTTTPTYDGIKKGWYNGLDLCIFADYINGSGFATPFYHDGNYVALDVSTLVHSSAMGVTWTDADFTDAIPLFSSRAMTTFKQAWVSGSNYQLLWRANGSSDTGHIVLHGDSSVEASYNTTPTVLDSSQIIELHFSAAVSSVASVWAEGWFFPKEM